MEYEKLVKVCEKVEKKLNEERLGGEVWVHGNGLPVFDVHISWGDWKHDHLRTRWVIEEMGGVYIGGEVTEEDGSDCYSAIHHRYSTIFQGKIPLTLCTKIRLAIRQY